MIRKIIAESRGVGLGEVMVEFLPPTSEAAGSNLGRGVSCWKVGSYLPMPSLILVFTFVIN